MVLLSVGELAARIGYERWRVRAALDVLFNGKCPRVRRYRVVPVSEVPRVRRYLKAEDRRNQRDD